MTTKEFIRIKENWDSYSNSNIIFSYYYLDPFDLGLHNSLKPDGDYFVCFVMSDYNASIDRPYFLTNLLDDSIRKVRIHHRKVQRVWRRNNKWRIDKWSNDNWRVEVRNDKLKKLGI